MKKILVTGGTVFVSRYIAEYYAQKGDDVCVLNRNTRPQPIGTTLIEADRRNLGDILRHYTFDLVIDTAYTARDVDLLLDALGSFGDYIFISSSAVYPETAPQPFAEESPIGPNSYWGRYGTDKIEAERALTERTPGAYILRPPYLYGPMDNVYREAFVFDCASLGRKFYLPKDGSSSSTSGTCAGSWTRCWRSARQGTSSMWAIGTRSPSGSGQSSATGPLAGSRSL